MVSLNWGEQKVDAGTAAMVVSLGPADHRLGQRLGAQGGPFGHPVGRAGRFVRRGRGRGGHDLGGRACVGGRRHALPAGRFVLRRGRSRPKPALRHASALQVTTFGAAIGALACLPVHWPARFRGYRCASVRHPKGLLPRRLPDRYRSTTWAYALARTPACRWGHDLPGPARILVMSWALLRAVPRLLVIGGGVLCLAGVAIRAPSPPFSASAWLRPREVGPPGPGSPEP